MPSRIACVPPAPHCFCVALAQGSSCKRCFQVSLGASFLKTLTELYSRSGQPLLPWKDARQLRAAPADAGDQFATMMLCSYLGFGVWFVFFFLRYRARAVRRGSVFEAAAVNAGSNTSIVWLRGCGLAPSPTRGRRKVSGLLPGLFGFIISQERSDGLSAPPKPCQ